MRQSDLQTVLDGLVGLPFKPLGQLDLEVLSQDSASLSPGIGQQDG